MRTNAEPTIYTSFGLSATVRELNSRLCFFAANQTGGGVRPLRVHIPDIEYEGCEKCLEFAYTASMELPDGDVELAFKVCVVGIWVCCVLSRV